MKPFDLERALAGDPVVTRDGREVPWLAYCHEAHVSQRVVALIKGSRELDFFNTNGRATPYAEHKNDLFMAPKKRTVWVNLFRRASGCEIFAGSKTFDSQETASACERSYQGSLIGAFPIEVEE